MLKKFWRLWAKALGAKAGNNNKEANIIALVRTLITLVYLITNFIIVLGVWRHWND